MASKYKSQAARDAEAMNYGTESYWQYLDQSAQEHFSLGEALAGNDGE